MTKEEGQKLIPAGSAVLVKTVAKLRFSNFFQKLILWWGKNIEHEDYVANHAAIYFGSGKGEIVEANGGIVRIRNVDQFFYPYNQVYFFHNVNTTVENLQKGKDLAYGRVLRRKGFSIKGRLYDFGELLRFGFPKIPDNKNADICSRLVWDVEQVMKNPIVDEDTHRRVSPARLMDYFIEAALAQRDGWVCSVVWDKIEFKKLKDII